jgi:hypothetical protein
MYTTEHKEFGTLLGDNQNQAKIADWARSMCNLQCGVLRMQQCTQTTSRNLGKKSARNYKGLKNATKARKFTRVTIWSMVSFCSLSLPWVSCKDVWFDLMLPFCFKHLNYCLRCSSSALHILICREFISLLHKVWKEVQIHPPTSGFLLPLTNTYQNRKFLSFFSLIVWIWHLQSHPTEFILDGRASYQGQVW